MRVYVFNPETDYALGCTGGNYSPPASVVRLRKSMALFPATYAHPGDAILLLDNISKEELTQDAHYDLILRRNLQIINLESLNKMGISPCGIKQDGIEIHPWGWNHSLRSLLLRNGIPSRLLKSEADIENIRSLAHRRTTIPFLKEISSLLPDMNVHIPNEFSNVEEALRFAENNPGSYFKMPWSSSGRGVICSIGMSTPKLTEWLRGAIARQGSVMGEYGYDRRADFATEWMCKNGKTEFIGLSWFDTSSNGKYIGNQRLSQGEIRQKIEDACNLFGEELIAAQKGTIDKLISPYYEGTMGIDMLADKQGNINPCVEINLRMTMGIATILSEMKIEK